MRRLTVALILTCMAGCAPATQGSGEPAAPPPRAPAPPPPPAPAPPPPAAAPAAPSRPDASNTIGVPRSVDWSIDDSRVGRAYLLPGEVYRPTKGNLPFGVILLQRADSARNRSLCSSFVNNMSTVPAIAAADPEANIIATYWLLSRDLPAEELANCESLLANYDYGRANLIRERYSKAEATGPVFLTLRLNEGLAGVAPDVFLLDLSAETPASVGTITMDWFSVVVDRAADEAAQRPEERSAEAARGGGFFTRIARTLRILAGALTCDVLTGGNTATTSATYVDPYLPQVRGTLRTLVHQNILVSIAAHTVGGLLCPGSAAGAEAAGGAVLSTTGGGGSTGAGTGGNTSTTGREGTDREREQLAGSGMTAAEAAALLATAERAFRARNWAAAYSPLQRLAESGHPTAQVRLAEMLLNGLHVQQNEAEAVRWFRAAAAQQDAEAYEHLGGLYRRGQGVPRDYATAMRWFTRAAEAGRASAEYNIGWMHEHGEGTPMSRTEAIRWYRLAAAKGMEDAEVALRRLGVR